MDRAEAGLASGLMNTSRQVGGSIGLAALATVASSHTHHLLGQGRGVASALASGYGRAFDIAGVLCAAAFAATFIVPAGVRQASAPTAQPAPTAPAVPTVQAAMATTDTVATEVGPDPGSGGVLQPDLPS